MPSLQRLYYSTLKELKRALIRYRAIGVDVEADLRKLGSVYVRDGNGYSQVTADQAMLLIRGPDRSPPYLRDRYAPVRGSAPEGDP